MKQKFLHSALKINSIFYRAKKLPKLLVNIFLIPILLLGFGIHSNAQLAVHLSKINNVSCHGAGNGEVEVLVTGATGAVTYKLDSGSYGPLNNPANSSFDGLGPGVHTICATDATLSPVCQTITITEPNEIIFTNATTVTQVSCPGNTGTINIDVTGGTVGPNPNAEYYLTTISNGVTTKDSFTTYYSGVPNYGTETFPGLAPGSYTITVEDNNYCHATFIGLINANTIFPAEAGGPVSIGSTVECIASATTPALASLPIMKDYSNNTLTPVGPLQQLSFTNNFNSAVTTSATAAPNVWYTDRYAPAGFTSPVSFGADNRLKLSINAADGATSRPGGFGGAFYNTQGRAFDLGTATDAVEIKLFMDPSWEFTNKRMAGLWGVMADAGNAVSGYPIVEFTSDGNNPRFHVWEDAVGWVDLGLPAGFAYNTWVTLKIRLLPTGQLLYSAGSLNYISTTYTTPFSVRIKSAILQGINTNAGVTYDIYWDDFTYNDAYATICEGNITYTYLYTDCGGLTTPWVYTYKVDRTTIPSEFGGPVSSSSSVQCGVDAIAPTTLPVVKDICGTTLSNSAPSHQLSLTNDFNLAVTTSPTAAPNVWYTDRYAPAGFVSPASFSGGNRLKQSIDAADGPSGRPGAFSSAFYNTQGRGFDVGAATDAVEIQLYVAAGWATTNKRMAGLWGVAVDATNTISGYPILEFNSDGNNPRFRAYDNGVWHDMGLPSGFAYGTWVTLKIRLLPSGQFLFSAGDKNYVSSEFTPPLSTRLKSVILQGHNYDPVISTAGVTYDIYWDNFTYNDAYATVCEGTTTYTYLYTDCSGLTFPWVYTYTIDRITPPAEFGPAASTSSSVQCWSDAVAPALPVFHDICGNTVNHTIGSPVISGTASNNSACDGSTVIYTYTYTDCSGLSTDWVYTYTLHHTNAPVVPVNASTNVQCLSDAVLPSNPGVNFIDQQQNDFLTNDYNANSVGQSFTCGITGKLLQVEVFNYDGSGASFDFEIFAGNGITGTLLSTSTQSFTGTGWKTITIPLSVAPNLISGNQYTFYLDGFPLNSIQLGANGNSYPGGNVMDSPPFTMYTNFDLMFRTHMGILDVCGNIIPTPIPVVTGTMSPCGGTKIYTYSYTDCAGLNSDYVYTYNINNTTLPIITGIINPSSVTGCSASDVPPPATTVADLELLGLAISDDCTPDVSLLVTSNDVPLNTCPIVVTRTYTVKDVCNNAATYAQTINVNSPAVVFNCATDKTEASCQTQSDIQASYVAWLGTTTASGGCNGVLSNNGPSLAPSACGAFVDVTWTYTSSCTPFTTTCTKRFTVTSAPPVSFTCADDHTEAACQTQGAINTAFTTWLGTTIASGGCNGSLVTVPSNPTAPSACGGATTVTWNYTSTCGTMQTCTKTFTVTNSSAPIITCPGNVTVNQHDSKDPWSTGYATSTNCSSPSVITYDDDRSHLNSCNATGYITRTWTATNSCGQSATCNQTITVNDVDNPIVTCPADITQANDAGLCSAVVNFTSTALDFGYFQGFENTSWLSGTFPNAPSTDWNEYNSKVTQVASGTDGITSKTGAGHAVINSTILPASPNNTSGAFNRLGGYSSVYGSGLIAKTDVYFDVNDASSNPTTYGWDLSVAMSNQSGAHLRDFIYHVSGDNTGIYVGSDNSSSFTRQSPAYIISQPHASITTSGWYTMEWETKNNAGNLAMDFNLRDASGAIVWTKTINTTDNIATTVGGNRYMWFTFVAANKLAIDNSSLQRKLSVTSSPASASIFNVGTTPVTSSATDACGHPGTCSFNVIVTDAQNPVISSCAVARTMDGCSTSAITGPVYNANLTASTYNEFHDATNQGVASDNCSITSVSYQDVITNAACPLVVTRTWIVKDAANNSATCPQTITVNAPSVVFNCATDKTEASCQTQSDIQASYVAWLGTTTASGGCNGVLSNNGPSLAPSACGAFVDVTWTYTSSCTPFTTTCTKRFTVTNSSAPIITCPGNVTVNQHDSKDPWSTGYATSTNCSSPSVITYDDDRSHLNSCNATGYITRTWTATNSCGQSATCNQTITVNDVDNPIVTCPADITQANDAGLCSAVVNFTSTALDFGYFQGFENTSWLSGTFPNAPSTDWNEYNSKVTQVASGTDGITSKTGAGHAVINSTILPASPNNTSGAFNRLGGYSSAYGSGLIAQTDVYFDMSDPALAADTYGWDLSVAMTDQSGAHLRDFIFNVGGDNTGIYVGASNNSSGRQSPSYLQSQAHASITTSGWYTMEWETKNNAGNLAMDFNLRNASGAIVWTKTINTTDNIATTVGGNRYMWFTFVAANKLAIDNSSLQRKLSVTSSPASASIFNVGTTPVTSSATDACGHPGTCSFNVIVTDAQNPVISSCAVARTMDGCSTSAITGPAYNANLTASTYNEFHDATNQGVATDNCSITSVTYQDVITNAACPLVVTRTWTVKDAANNSATCPQIITVNAPVVNFTCGTDVTLASCTNQATLNAAWANFLASTTASGGCNGVLSNNAPLTPPSACGGSNTAVTWTYTSSCTTAVTCTRNFVVTAPGSTGVTITARALLQGPYVLADTLMHDSLRVLGLVPTNEPYTSVPADGVVVEPGGETVSPAVLAITGPHAIVDWVYLELRAEATPSNILARKRALIRRDGQIVSNSDGVSPVYFPNVCQGNYYVVIKHRNHLAVMTQSAITLNGCSTPYFDFTSSAVYINPIIVNLPRKLIGSKNTLWSCDANHNKNIRYNGTSNDKDPILLVVGYSNPNNSIPGYRSEDLNMDGKVRYNNTDNDRTLIINNVGISNPNTTLNQHTPN